MTDNESQWHTVCQLDDISDPGAYGFKVQAGKYPLFGFVVQKDGELYGYTNVCPHAGRPLDWAPHAFLTRDKDLIMCSAHGATFELDTGLCVGGPCLGRALKPWTIKVEGNTVLAERPPEPVVR